MRVIGRGSLSSFLKVAVDVAWVVACALLGFIWIVTIVSLVPVPAFERIAIDEPHRLAVWTMIGTIFCLGAMVICAYLRGVFETLVVRDPFVPENAKRFAAIGIVLAIMEGASMFVTTLASLLLAAMGLAGENPPFVFPRVNWPVWFAVLTLLVLAQVFREGAAMREEQKMTI
jgi:hypothetical protein